MTAAATATDPGGAASSAPPPEATTTNETTATTTDASRKRKAEDMSASQAEKGEGEVPTQVETENVKMTAAAEEEHKPSSSSSPTPPTPAEPSDDAQEDKTKSSSPQEGEKASEKIAAVVDPNHPYNSLKWKIVENDGTPANLIKLVALKSLFSKQLPKMPRAYIARLVFDKRHISLAILNDDPAVRDTDEEVIGAICYRPFPDMRFAEIAFCAVNASHQVKGYGTKLMNLVKLHGARTGIEYFITYADNYAIGYFKKQGFSKTIAMPKGRYQGLIKDYDGGTPMECYVHPSVDFTRIPQMVAAQKKFLLDTIVRSNKANSLKVYPPLPKDFQPNLEGTGVSRANESAARAMTIPGMVEAGWTLSDLLAATGQGKDVDRAKNQLKSDLLALVRKVEEQQFAWPFREPVDTTQVKDYLEVVKEPIDLLTIDRRIRRGDHYKSKKMLYTDLLLMVNNCKLYNEEASTYVQCATKLEKYLETLFTLEMMGR